MKEEDRHTMTSRLIACAVEECWCHWSWPRIWEEERLYIARERPQCRDLIQITCSVILLLIFNKEDIRKHIALIIVIVMRITDCMKTLSLGKLPATFHCSETTESLSYLQKLSLLSSSDLPIPTQN